MKKISKTFITKWVIIVVLIGVASLGLGLGIRGLIGMILGAFIMQIFDTVKNTFVKNGKFFFKSKSEN